ncbi:unnamed protein product [Sympodiomycopsis kandeliae]
MASSSQALVLIPSSINIDETFAVPHIVRPGETLSSGGLSSRPGGKGANVSSALGLSGCESWFVGNVGKDAPWPLEELEKRGVNVSLAGRLDGTPTGRAFIQIAEDGENSIVLLKGANFPSADAPSANPSSIFSSLPRAPTHIVLQNEIPLATTAAYQSHAHAAGVLTIWNPSPLPTAEELKAWNWSELDVLIVNQGEGLDLIEAFTGKSGSEEEDAIKTLETLSSLPQLSSLSWIVMTRGSKGVAASVLLQGSSAGDRKTFSLPASRPKSVKDTTGAGDTFAGYLVSSLAKAAEQKAQKDSSDIKPREGPQSEDEVKACLTRAKVAAAMAVEIKGAMESIPNSEQVDERLKSEL